MATTRQLKTGVARFNDLIKERQQAIKEETFTLHQRNLATSDAIRDKVMLHSHLESIQNGLRILLQSLGGKKVRPTSSAQATRLGVEIQQHLAHQYLEHIEGGSDEAWYLLAAWRFIGSKPATKPLQDVGLATFGLKYMADSLIADNSVAGCTDDNMALADATAEPKTVPDNVSPIA